MPIGLVTDSTAVLPPYRLVADRISVVPVIVNIDDESFAEGSEINTLSVLQEIAAGKNVTTSRPTPESFAAQYAELAAAGYSEILSIHLSADLSGTYEAAVLGAIQSGLAVQVVDSRSVGLGLGFSVIAAAAAIRNGADIAAANSIARRTSTHSRTWVVVEDLSQLRKSGRVSLSGAMVGSALQVRPILEIVSGNIGMVEKVRTTHRAIDRIVELARNYVREFGGDFQLGLQHANAPEKAAEVAIKLGRAIPGISITTADLGAVLTAHVGAGAIAVTASPLNR